MIALIRMAPRLWKAFVVLTLFYNLMLLCPVWVDQGKAAEPVATPQVSLPPAATVEDGQWLMAAKDYANSRYSALDQITTGNVKHLQVALTFSTGILRGHEAAPLVVHQTLYVVTLFPNTSTPSTSRSQAYP
jgi:glucose dehydrogenase